MYIVLPHKPSHNSTALSTRVKLFPHHSIYGLTTAEFMAQQLSEEFLYTCPAGQKFRNIASPIHKNFEAVAPANAEPRNSSIRGSSLGSHKDWTVKQKEYAGPGPTPRNKFRLI
ncbi:hypothetical protein Pelo_4359 [Pelomyxa schiedti]|nr:hypothetical protein Pelo_4359 [Pelomyxa schiedti]